MPQLRPSAAKQMTIGKVEREIVHRGQQHSFWWVLLRGEFSKGCWRSCPSSACLLFWNLEGLGPSPQGSDLRRGGAGQRLLHACLGVRFPRVQRRLLSGGAPLAPWMVAWWRLSRLCLEDRECGRGRGGQLAPDVTNCRSRRSP